MFKVIIYTMCLFALASCSKQQGRRPISVASGSFMKESIARNKKLNLSEEGILDSIMKSRPKTAFISSKKGYWYYYENRNMLDTITPKKGDVAYFDYNIKDVYGNMIYSEAELQPQVYRVDKENIMMGLRDGIKLMRRKDKVVFLFPSVLGYGYFGDKNKIGANVPIICTVTLNDFRPEAIRRPKAVSKTTEIPITEIKDNKEDPEQQIKPE